MNAPKSWNAVGAANGMGPKWARSVCSPCAPYGYRYVNKQDGAGEARFEIILEEARVVRQVFAWVGQDRCTIGEVRRRLEAGQRANANRQNDLGSSHHWGMLKNPAYKGEAAFGKTRRRTTPAPATSPTRTELCNPNVPTPITMFPRAMDEYSCSCSG